MYRELRRPNVTLMLSWEEYCDASSDSFSYSWFCGISGDVHSMQIFVAVLGASNYTYAEASLSQSLPDWIASHVRAFAYFGGTARQTVSDNLKAGVTPACFREPMGQPDLCRSLAPLPHCYRAGTAISAKGQSQGRSWGPNRRAMDSGASAQPPLLLARRPQRVDLRVPCRAERSIPPELGRSRRELFEELDHPALTTLPNEPDEYGEWKRCLNFDCHVEIAKHYYSVPHNLVHQEVEPASPRRSSRYFSAASGCRRICAAPCRIARR
ncbi:Mu transposase domain-containing protein [Bradyrhizobium cosmicum]|uniref:Mu transposase domain-containing protein n=1 Tax=Bradyrhizobium cosmicum TaxID=1404864 RepID=UPI0028E49328|nr:hypothetical protein [Bradyrhizobium cosmicum]